MQTQKKLVLASVVSMMLVLAFMVGFVPSHDAETTGASGSADRVDTSGLLDMVLGDKSITSIVPSSPVAGLVYQTPAGGLTPYIPVNVTAAVTEATTIASDLYYVVDPVETPGFNTDVDGHIYWAGPADQYAGPVPPTDLKDYPALFDFGPKVPVVPGFTQYALNALAAIGGAYPTGTPATIYYYVKNRVENQILVGIDAVAASADADGNGLPDDLAAILPDGAWVASVVLNPTKADAQELRDVTVRDLDTSDNKVAGGGTVIIPVRSDVTVEVPDQAALEAVGAVNPGETVMAVVTVTEGLSGSVDSVDGTATQAARQQWANEVLAGTPGTPVVGAPIVQIAFVADVAGSFVQVDDLKGLTSTLTITGITDLAANSDKDVEVWGLHTATDGRTVTNVAGSLPADALHIGDGAPTVDYANGTLKAVLSTFSAFVPLYPGLRVFDIDPKVIEAEVQVPMTVTGIFPTDMGANFHQGLTVDEATANYSVFINGALAAFRNVDRAYTLPNGDPDTAHEAVTLLQTNPLVPNKMYITSPIIPTPDKAFFVDVTVKSLTNPADSFTLSGTLQVNYAPVPLTILTPANGTIVADPVQPAGGYPIGTVVTLTATGDPNFAFSTWNGPNAGDLLPSAVVSPVTIAMNSAKTIGAEFLSSITTARLTLTAGTGGSVAATPLGISGGTLYNLGSAVTITATPDSNYSFVNWTGASAASLTDPTNPVQNIVMGAGREFIANFKLELLIDSVDPPRIPADISVPMTLTGIFPTVMAANLYQGLTVDEATTNYSVFIGGALASFRNVDRAYTLPGGTPDTAHEAVTRLQTNPLVHNSMYLWSPNVNLAAKAATTFVDVKVQSLYNPALSVTLSATLEVSPTGTVVVTMSGSGSGSVDVTPPNGSITLSDSTIIDFPLHRYFIGDAVSAQATAAPGSSLTLWTFNGTASGNAATLPFNVTTNPTNLDAQFDLPTFYSLTVPVPVNGTIDVLPPQPFGGYLAGTSVTLTATADPGFQFNTWNGPNAADLQPNALVSVVTLVMNGAKTVGADFEPLATTARLTLTAGVGGTVAASPLGISDGELYIPGAPVTITATASSNYEFVNWTGASAASLVDATNPMQNITMDADKEFVANFRQVLNITAITPNNAWIFGGVVAKVSGMGLSASTQFTLGGKTVWGFNAAGDGSSIDIIIPATDDRSDSALVITSLTASQADVVTEALPFTYKRYFENTVTGMNTTAFILDTPAVENTVKLDTGGGDISSGNLIIPGLNTGASQVYGIVLDQKLVVGEVKCTTAPVPAGDLSASLIDTAAAGSGVENSYDFSIFLYKDNVDKTAPAAQTGVYVDASADLGATLGRSADADGIPNAGTAMKVTLPLDGTGLSYADVRKGLALWGIEAQYDYVSNTESITDPKVEAYQSELLENEVDPNMTATTPDADQPDQMLKARLYSLNGYSLRKEWTLPEDVAAAVRLAKVDDAAVSGTGSGPVCGGTVLTLVSPLGGLGYVDRVVLREPAKLGGRLGGTATETFFVSRPGADEYTFAFKTPKSCKAGVVDIVIYLKSSPEMPAAVLSKSFEYKAKSANLTPLLIVLLGVVLALIGVAAGHDSGNGGGGGPCFIATAAYGTPLVAEIDTLRAVRDTYLLDNAVGSAFVDGYYRVSPAIADAVAQSPVLGAVVRLVLVPVIFVGKLALMMPVPLALLAMALGAVCMLRRRARGRA